MLSWLRSRVTDSRPGAARTQAQSYTDMLVHEFELLALGSREASAAATSALETVCMIYSSCLAAMKVSERSITPEIMSCIGRDLIRRGESLWRVELDGSGAVRLSQIATHSVHGRSSNWRYEAHLLHPSGSDVVDLSRDEVLHFTWATDPVRGQWQGISPLALAATSMSAIGKLEKAILDESGIPPSQLIPMPSTAQNAPGKAQSFLDAGDTDAHDSAAAAVWGSGAAARGNVMVVPSLTIDIASWTNSKIPQAGSPGSYKPYRTGAEFGNSHDSIRRSLAHGVLSACGIPVSLGGVDQGSGTESREAFRRFYATALAGLVRRLQSEFRVKLDDPGLEIDASPLNAADVIGRARSFQALANGGMKIADAARISGVLADQE